MTPLQLRVEALRQRRAAAAADRAAFEERRKHGLRARQQAKLAHLAARADNSEETHEDQPTTEDPAAEHSPEQPPAPAVPMTVPPDDQPGTEAA